MFNIKNSLLQLHRFLSGNYWILIIYCIIVAVLSLLPQTKLPPASFESEDLVVHFVMYATMAYLVSKIFDSRIKSFSILDKLLVVLLIAFFGFIMEVLQYSLPINRSFSLLDALINLIGSCMFFIFASKKAN